MLTTVGDLLAERTSSAGGVDRPPAIVALPGWMRSAADFAPILEGLDAAALHLPGFGVSAEPPAVWGTAEYADAVAAAIEPYGAVILLGHSFGGRVAVRLAARRPDLVSGLVLTGVPLIRLVAAPKPKLGFRIVRALAKTGLVSQKTLEAQRRKRGSADYNAAHGVMRDILVKTVAETYADDLARIQAPARMVWGERDTAAPADAGQAASELIAHARFRVVPGAGHLLDAPLAAVVREELLTLTREVSA